MNVTELRNEGLTREFKVVIPHSDIDDLVSKRLMDLGPKVKMDGFRHGKIPLSILKRKYGPSTRSDVLSDVVQSSIQKVINNHSLTPAMHPQVSHMKGQEGEDLEFVVTLENLPAVEPKPMEAISIERLKASVSEDEVDKRLVALCKEHFTPVPVKGVRAAKLGDILLIDFDGMLEEGGAIDGGSGKDFHLELGSGTFIPGFEDQLVGAKKGEEKAVYVAFPKDYQEKKLAGRKAIFSVTVKEVCTKEPAQVDDEFAKQWGAESFGQLRKMLFSQIEQEYAHLTRTHMKRQLLDFLAQDYAFDVPASMVDAEFDAIWHQLTHALKAGTRQDVLGEDADKSDEDLKQEYRKIAERRVRLGLLLAEVGRRHQIVVTSDELKKAIESQARQYRGQEQKVFEYYLKNQEALMRLKAPLFEEKVIDYIFSIINVIEREVTHQELMDQADAL